MADSDEVRKEAHIRVLMDYHGCSGYEALAMYNAIAGQYRICDPVEYHSFSPTSPRDCFTVGSLPITSTKYPHEYRVGHHWCHDPLENVTSRGVHFSLWPKGWNGHELGRRDPVPDPSADEASDLPDLDDVPDLTDDNDDGDESSGQT
jgi:hypothetical protein